MEEQSLSNYTVVQTYPNYLVLKDEHSDKEFIYKEYEIPSVSLFYNKNIDEPNFITLLEQRKKIDDSCLIKLQLYLVEENEVQDRRFGLLFENYIKNFDEELSKRRGTDQFWTEEELINTFEACLLGLKTLHGNNIIHGNITAKSIVFGIDGFVKIADYFVNADDFRAEYEPKQLSLWAPELITHGYRDIANDLWQMGLVFLEASILKSSLEIYKPNKQGDYQIDITLLNKRLQECQQLYGNNLNAIIELLLSPEPEKRVTIYKIFEQSAQTEQIEQNEIIQEQPQIENIQKETFIINNNEDNKQQLSMMLEDCLARSKEILKQNEQRKYQINDKSNRVGQNSQDTVNQSSIDTHKSLNQMVSSNGIQDENNPSLRDKMASQKRLTSIQSEFVEVCQNFGKVIQKCSKNVLYIGQWFNNQPNGIGCMTNGNYELANNQCSELEWSKYEGEFEQGVFNGKGKLYLQNGDAYYGEFKKGRIEGNGILTNSEKSIVGRWERNELKLRLL